MAALEKVRVAMIGAGGMANAVHYPSLASFADVEIAAICDLEEDRRNATGEKYGIAARYCDFRKMLDEVAPDAVYAIGQPHLMYDVWVACLSRGQNLCIEKPMGVTIHQARTLAHLADKHGVLTQVSFQRRSCPMVMLLRDKCLERGPLTHAVCEFYKCEPSAYLGAPGHMMDDGVHALDTLRWMCGGEVVEIQPILRRVGTPDINFFSVLLGFDNGATGVWMSSWSSGRRTFRVQMHAPGICAEAEHEVAGTLFADGDTKGVRFDAREVAGSDQLWGYAGFATKNRQFIDAIKTKTQPPSCFADAVKTMELAEKILALGLRF